MKNVVFVLIDDLGWSDLSCYKSSFYETPNLDRLAKSGCLLTDAYAASPVCSPTRASLLTGRYPSRVGITQYMGGHTVGYLGDVPYFYALPASEYSLAQALKDGGYQTWHVGKWHLGEGSSSPQAHGFDVNIGGCEWGRPLNGFFSPYNMPNLENGPEGEYLTDRLTKEAIDLIKVRDRQKPFFLNLWHYAVHTPIEAPEHLVKKYEAKAKELGLDSDSCVEEGEELPFLDGLGRHVKRRRIQSHPTYAAMVENLDANIGLLLDTLESEGLREETLVVFSSDNGGLATAEGSPTCNAPLKEGKGWAEEGGLRVPAIFSCPGLVPEGQTLDTPFTSPDLYPTLLEFLGLPSQPDQHIDGVSYTEALKGKSVSERSIFWHYPHYSNQGGRPSGAVRRGRYKLIEHFEQGNYTLYDLENDIGEKNDVSEDNLEITSELSNELKKWRESHKALMPQKNRRWEDQRKEKHEG